MSSDEPLVLCETLTTRVAGYRYHAPTSTAPGAAVQFVREPLNAWDPNAITVCDTDGRKLGYVFREIAEEYAALMDRGCVRLCGRMAAPGEPAYDPHQARRNPALHVWVYVDDARLSEILSRSDAVSPRLGAIEESTAIAGD